MPVETPTPDTEVAEHTASAPPVEPISNFQAKLWEFIARLLVVGFGIFFGLIAAFFVGLFTGLINIC